MNMQADTERSLRLLLSGIAAERPPERLFDAAMAATATVRQRPGWLARLEMAETGRAGRRPETRGLLVVAGLLLATALGLWLVGGGSPDPTHAPSLFPSPSPSRSLAATPSATPRTGLILPGESWILYERFVQMGGGLFAMRPDGTDSHPVLTDVPGTLKEADWSPDGDRVVVVDADSERMWIVGIDGSNQTAVEYCDLNPGCGKPAWSPDGSRIAFSRSESEVGVVGPAAVGIYTLDIASGVVSQVIRLERPLLVDVPRWSPDGTQLVVGVDRMDDDANETGAAVAIVSAAGGEPRYLTDLGLFGYEPDWSPTGDTIVFSVQVREFISPPVADDTWNLYVVSVDGTNLRQLTDVPSGTRLWFPVWTPDGTSILAADQGRRLAVLVDPGTGAVTSIGGASLAQPVMRPLP